MLGMLGLVLWVSALSQAVTGELRARQAEAAPRVKQLRDAFGQLRDRQHDVPRGLLEDFQRERLTLGGLVGVRLQAEPFFNVALVDARGRHLLAGDRSDAPPAWAVAAAAALPPTGWLVALRPLPGVHALGAPAGGYLLLAAHHPHGQLLLANANLAHVFGPWLAAQAAAAGLAHVDVLGPEATWRPEPPLPAALPGLPPTAWSYRVATFFPEGAHPFQQVRVVVDAESDVRRLVAKYVLALATFALVMGSLALSITLAARDVRRALALAAARSNFTAMVGHELRTPVAAIRMYGEILVHGLVQDPTKTACYHRTILREAGRLQRLIEHLLDLGKIERGACTYALAPYDANELVETAIAEALAATPADAVYQIERTLAPMLPAARADRVAATQAIANLVSNALKYGGKPPQVHVVTRHQGDTVVVEVLDRGPGIPPAQRQAIFEPFVRLEDEARRESQGTGLGLALIKGYMEGQGGHVCVEERAGGGSVFRLTFPAA